VVAQREVPVAGEPHDDAEDEHEQRRRVAKGDQADRTDEDEHDPRRAKEEPAENPGADHGDDRYTEDGECHLAPPPSG
jgi:hypothetical protein